MKNVLILYPELFNCQTKFDRKVTKILSNSDEFSISYFSDPNKLIKSLFAADNRVLSSDKINDGVLDAITHAIVFDDGEEFKEELEQLKQLEIPTRCLKISITRVINIKRETQYEGVKSTPDYEYIGRGSYWGNPYSMYEEGDSRERVIEKYKYDFDFEKFPNKEKKEVFKLAGKRLGCFCKPQACHGDVLADFLNAWDDGK